MSPPTGRRPSAPRDTPPPSLRVMFARAREVLGNNRGAAFWLLLVSTGTMLAQLTWAPLIGWAARPGASLTFISLAQILVVGLAAIGGKVLSRTLRAKINARLIADVQRRLHAQILSLGASFHRKHGRGELVQTVMQSSAGAASFSLELTVTPISSAIGTLAGLGYLTEQFRHAPNPVPAVLVVVTSVLVLPYASVRLAGRLRAAFSRVRAQQTAVHEQLAQSLADPLGLQMADATAARQLGFEGATMALLPTQEKASVVAGLATELPALAGLVLQLMLLTAVVLSSGETADPGAVAASALVMVIMAPQVASSVATLMTTYTMGSQMWPEVEQVFSILDEPAVLTEGHIVADFVEAPQITLEDVIFQYEGTSSPVLAGASLLVPAGATTAIVAASGAGKSTVLRLLGRLYDVESGVVRIGATDVRDLRFASLRAYRSVARCAQEPTFVNASIRDNIRLFVPEATDAGMATACRDVGIWEAMVAASAHDPLGLVVTNNQTEGALSGGQRKRLELARALCAAPHVLLLDEPTTGVAKTDKPALVRAVREAAAGRTCIIVEHDLDFVVAVADRAAVLQQGRFVEEDTIAALISTDSVFRGLAATTLHADDGQTT